MPNKIIETYNEQEAVKYRWNQLDSLMETENLDVVVIYGKGIITQYGFLYYFGGYYPILRPGFIIYAKEQKPIAYYTTRADSYLAKQMGFIDDARFLGTGDVIHSEADLYKHIGDLINSYEPDKIGVVGLESMMSSSQSSMLKNLLDAEVLDITENIEKIKGIKSPDEQEGIRQSFSLALESFEEFKNAIRPGRTSAEIAADIEKVARAKGAIDTLIFIEEGPYFLRKPTSAKITNNSLVTAYVELIDENGYWVEKGGLFIVGEVSEEELELAQSCVSAIKEIQQTLKPGIPINTVAKIIDKHTDKLDVNIGIWHGHGIGVDHDLPILTDSDTSLFEEDMVISVHPNYSDKKEKYGVSIADVFIITKDGAESLSQGEYDIIKL
ncbi:M24 family metallopeptidase [Planococcus sp. APC 3900]|uniref:M24 family metallopeptidase n=1 Tax=Planococcus sp. APC 3900 TaxID=3035191 RepID=UPI0025B61A7B|nr:M24 family metallopeptidase [Planococcus sp. APC 3900]MDN3436836.1 M24 family metallopeptidase [Planococcus sp. APC 3900]